MSDDIVERLRAWIASSSNSGVSSVSVEKSDLESLLADLDRLRAPDQGGAADGLSRTAGTWRAMADGCEARAAEGVDLDDHRRRLMNRAGVLRECAGVLDSHAAALRGEPRPSDEDQCEGCDSHWCTAWSRAAGGDS